MTDRAGGASCDTPACTCYNVDMAWDSSRPVPWARLMREWVIYAVFMTFVFLVFFRDSGAIGAIAGLLVSGPLYLLLGTVLAKFGYTRKSFRDLRAERATASREGASTEPGSTPRPRPAPTRRTGGGTRPGARRRR